MNSEKLRIPGRWRRNVATYASTVVVLALAIVILIGLRRERTRDAWLLHTQRVQLALERTLSDMRDAEVGQRGFLLTGDSAYLEPYRRGIAGIAEHTREVTELTADNAAQQQRAARMKGLIDRRMRRLDATLAMGIRGFRDSAAASARLGTGRLLMDSLRANIAEMIAAEDTLMVQREAATQRQEQKTLLVVLIGSIIAATVALYLNMLLASLASSQQKAATTLAEQASELELQAEHLQEQTIELEQQRDELMESAVELESRTAAAEEANRAKSDFLRAMSHELRTPLNAIGGYTELIELGIRGPVTEEQREDLSRIQRSQRHLLSLINDVLNYAKLEAGHVSYEMLDISMHEIITAVDELVRPQMEAKSITYHCDAGPEDLLVRVDPEKALQVMLNLLSNAVKFTPENGQIEVWVDQVDGMVLTRVRDNGAGIPPDRHEAIFEPFIQVGRTLSGGSEGTGLGLAISRDLARGMGGDLTVESRPGHGSTFSLTLKTTAKAAA